MTRLRDLPLHQKFMRIMLLSSGTALLVAWLAFALGATLKLVDDTNSRLSTLAQATAYNLQAAMAFGDEKEARATLASLKADKSITHACILIDRKPFAALELRYADDLHCTHTDSNFLHMLGGHVHIANPILLEGEQLGSLHITADITPVLRTLGSYLLLMAMLAPWPLPSPASWSCDCVALSPRQSSTWPIWPRQCRPKRTMRSGQGQAAMTKSAT